MSTRLEEMLRIAQAATKGPWKASAPDGSYHDVIRIFADETPEGGLPVAICPQQHSPAFAVLSGQTNETTAAACVAQHIATFNPRTAEALVKVALVARASQNAEDTDDFWDKQKLLREALSALTAAMESSNVG